jgi:hypothetical protein
VIGGTPTSRAIARTYRVLLLGDPLAASFDLGDRHDLCSSARIRAKASASAPLVSGAGSRSRPFFRLTTEVKRLYLLRHAKSSWSDPALADAERPLAPRGRKAAKKMAKAPRDPSICQP